jgi:hypothetical protein
MVVAGAPQRSAVSPESSRNSVTLFTDRAATAFQQKGMHVNDLGQADRGRVNVECRGCDRVDGTGMYRRCPDESAGDRWHLARHICAHHAILETYWPAATLPVPKTDDVAIMLQDANSYMSFTRTRLHPRSPRTPASSSRFFSRGPR